MAAASTAVAWIALPTLMAWTPEQRPPVPDAPTAIAALAEPAVPAPQVPAPQVPAPQVPQSAGAAAERKPFSHAAHVPMVWAPGASAQPEQARDCRGCHVFGQGGAVDAPQTLCANCHRDPGALDAVIAPGWEKDLAAQRTSLSRSFHHDTHSALSCRQCHGAAEKKNRAGAVDVPAHLPIPTSSLSCEACHGAAVTATDIAGWDFLAGARPDGLTPEQLQRAFAKINDGRIAPPTDGRMRPFEHADHLAPEFLSGANAGQESMCTVCHVAVSTARHGEAGLQTVSADGCKSCHIGQSGQPLGATTETSLRPSPSVSTFAHADHYGFRTAPRTPGVANQAAYDKIGVSAESTSCGACHAFDIDGRAGDEPRDFPFVQGGPHSYDGCHACHSQCTDEALWTTAAGLHDPDAPADEKTGEKASGNDAIGWQRATDEGPRACTSCHAFGTPTMATNRPTTEVTRPDATAFGFLGNAHPHITRNGAKDPAVDCSACHVAESEAQLRSRLDARPFRHDVHLSPAGSVDPETASNECLTCHTQARVATGGAALACEDNGATYLLTALKQAADANAEAGCAACHRSTAVLPQWTGADGQSGTAAPTPITTATVRFAHSDHGTVACADCHEPLANPTPGAPTMSSPKAADCTQCHDHKAGSANAAHTGRIEGTDVASCATCHGVETSQPIAANRGDAGSASKQGPARGVPTRRADKAHAQDPRYFVELELFARFDGVQYHPVPGDANYGTCSDCHQVDRGADTVRYAVTDHLLAEIPRSYHDGGANFGSGVSCYGCHWRRPNAGPERFATPEAAESAETRTAIGADLTRFPGPDASSR